MVWFIQKTMSFRFKFSDFDLYFNILIFLNFKMAECNNTWFDCHIPTVAFVQESSVCNAEHFNYIWYHGSLLCIQFRSAQ